MASAGAAPSDLLGLRYPAVMGILNVTPDSFSDGGRYFAPEAALRHAREMVADGAQIIDVGGESTRPGSDLVGVDEELRRVLPVVEALAAEVALPLSVDTMKAEVARRALQAGAHLINDVSALRYDPEMAVVVAEARCSVCLMHMQGEPKTMQNEPHYDDVVAEVERYLVERMAFAVDAGIAEEQIILDPGIGFGKTVEHNLSLLRHLDRFVALGRPVLLGTSRKRFIAAIVGGDLAQRDLGTLVTTVAAALAGVHLFRVHDVKANVEALRMASAIRASRPS